MTQSANELYAQLYDLTLQDWDGEYQFYRALAQDAHLASVLEIACGTGRIAIRLAEDGFNVTGTDPLDDMLNISRVAKANISKTSCGNKWI